MALALCAPSEATMTLVAFIRSSKKGWQCWSCKRRWMYDELTRAGNCPHCGGVVTRTENALHV